MKYSSPDPSTHDTRPRFLQPSTKIIINAYLYPTKIQQWSNILEHIISTLSIEHLNHYKVLFIN